MNKMNIKCWGDKKPVRGSEFAAGIDLYNNGDSQTVYSGRGSITIETMTAMEIPIGYVGLVYVRSGLGFKGLNLINSCGVIDADYRGEIKLRFTYNRPEYPADCLTDSLDVNHGERVAQIVIVPYNHLELNFVDELSETERGEGGFGSTGKI